MARSPTTTLAVGPCGCFESILAAVTNTDRRRRGIMIAGKKAFTGRFPEPETRPK
jgi:hypothetical protein